MQGNVEKNVSGTVDLSHIEKVDLAWLFNGDKPNIEYIHLPMNLIGKWKCRCSYSFAGIQKVYGSQGNLVWR